MASFVTWRRAGLALLVAALAACGGSKSEPQAVRDHVFGTAAAGAPIIGTVTLKDSAGAVRTARIAADGGYDLDVTGLRPPFMVRADGTVGGRRYSVFSAGVAADVNGRINVTPLTDLIVANVAQDLASAYFDAGVFTGLTRAELDAKAAALREQLLPVLDAVGLGATVDLLRQSFAADHSGLDAVLDVVRVDMDPATKVATVTNILNGSALTADVVDATYAGTMTGAGVAAGLSAFDAIVAQLAKLQRLYATRVPTSAELTAAGIFDRADFLDQGRDWARFETGLLTGTPVGIQFGGVALESLGPDSGWVTFDVGYEGAIVDTVRTLFRKDPGSGAWLFAGDRQLYQVELNAHATYIPMETNGPTIQSGLLLDVRDPTDRLALGSYAVLRGPGLGQGIRFEKTIHAERFTSAPPWDQPFIGLDPVAITSIPESNPQFTLDVYAVTSVSTTLDATLTLTVPRRPEPATRLTPASFIQLGTMSPSNLVGFAGGTIAVTFSPPAGLTPQWLFASVSDTGNTHTAWIDGTIAPGKTSGTIVAAPATFSGWTVGHGMVIVGGTDQWSREYETFLSFF
jgi:hypothetical protein